jgi:hypothetical protein
MESSLCERPLTREVREGLVNFVMGTSLWELRYGNFVMGTMLCERCYGNFVMGTLLWELCYGNDVMGTLLWELCCSNRQVIPITTSIITGEQKLVSSKIILCLLY